MFLTAIIQFSHVPRSQSHGDPDLSLFLAFFDAGKLMGSLSSRVLSIFIRWAAQGRWEFERSRKE